MLREGHVTVDDNEIDDVADNDDGDTVAADNDDGDAVASDYDDDYATETDWLIDRDWMMIDWLVSWET